MKKEEIQGVWWFLNNVKESTIYNTDIHIKALEKDIKEKDLIKYKKEWREYNG